MNQTNIREIADKLKAAQRPLILTGAGVSTHLGVPDFRSEDTGLYIGESSIMEWMTEDYRDRVGEQAYQRKFEEISELILGKAPQYAKVVNDNAPDAVHENIDIIAEKTGAVILTQNVDMLHKIIANRRGSKVKVVEAHGSADKPKEIVLFGSMLPKLANDTIAAARTGRYDYCLVLGSSLQVGPVNSVPMYIRNYDIIAKDKSSVSNMYTKNIHESEVEPFLAELVKFL